MKFTKMAKYWFYGLLISLCLGCAQKTAEEKTLWFVEKLDEELNLRKDQERQLKALSQDILEAQSKLKDPVSRGFQNISKQTPLMIKRLWRIWIDNGVSSG